MNRKRIKEILLKFWSHTVIILTTIWVWLRTQIYPWARQHPAVSTFVVMTIFYLWLSVGAERRREFRDWPSNEQVTQTTAEGKQKVPAPTPKLPEDPDKRAAMLGWDPANENTPAEYKLPVKLSEKQARQLIADLSCVSDFYAVRADLSDSYSKIYKTLQRSQSAIYRRIETQKGFRYPELCYRWYEFINAGDVDNVFTLTVDWSGTAYIEQRVNQIRFRLIGGQYTVGDVQFVSAAIQNVINEYKQFEPRTRRAMQLRDWITEDGLIVSAYSDNSPSGDEDQQIYNQMRTPLDTHPDLQGYVDNIYFQYHGHDGTPPRIAP